MSRPAPRATLPALPALPRALAALLAATSLGALTGCATGRAAFPPVPPRHATAPAEVAARAAAEADLALDAAVASLDRAAFAALLGEEVVFMTGRGPAQGPAAVLDAWASFFAADGPRLRWEPDRALGAGSGDMAFTSGPWTFEAEGKPAEHGRYLTAWRRGADGAWRVTLDGDAAPLPRLPATVSRRIVARVASADGSLGAEAGLLLDGDRKVGQYLSLWRAEGGRRAVIAEGGRYQPSPR